MLPSKKRISAFTLLEMLIVIVIIAVLAGMVLKLMSIAKHFQSRAACMSVIERVSYALNEYRAEYGQYPPVPAGVCPNLEGACHYKDCRTCYTTAPGVGGSAAADPAAATYLASYGGKGVFCYGLVSYLIPRVTSAMYAGVPSYAAGVDQPRDDITKRRWMSFLTNIVDGCENNNWHGRAVTNSSLSANIGSSSFNYYVPVYTIKDPWGHTFRYRSSAPYSSYELWSAGPDGRDGDRSHPDVNSDKEEKAKDNIHYKHGKWDG
ncbi:MAG: hypothetical protein A2283_04350 [Lentisphaerae bacterium RIFOXYA12_FULL_48_11]|nr:MAG: hypothetical protein A2283_04350 [Lentisphaerae bacterium RIFOXYA12_FULL_48_11]